MKVCPFCKEEIHDEAIKCRYCSSSLLPVQPSATPDSSARPFEGDNTMVYVLDKGLIRFGKFVAGALAIFVAIGIYLYGVDLKESGKEVEAAAKQVQTSAESISKTRSAVEQAQADITKAQTEVSSDDQTVTKLVADTKTSVAALQSEVTEVQAKEAQARAAADRAQTVEKNIEAEEASLQQTKTQSAVLLVQAKQVADEIAEKRKEVDIAVAHINLFVPVTSEEPAHASAEPSSAAGAPGSGPAPSYTDVSFTAPELAKLYHFPLGVNGRDQTIALIELGGGYRDSDLDEYFSKLGTPKPKIAVVSVDGAKNTPDSFADGEVESNIEIAGSVAPGATIAVYFAPNTNQGFTDAIALAAHDGLHKPSVISISWGSPEEEWAAQGLAALNGALQECVAAGITVVVASGDSGESDGVTDGQKHVDFPASSPFVLAVGGTHLHAAGDQIISETVWDEIAHSMGATGRGISRKFPVPEWQRGVSLSAAANDLHGRAVPDVAADASPSTGYRVVIDGKPTVVGGTAEVAPLWAGLIALINQKIGRNVGYLNPVLYQKLGPRAALRRVGVTQSQPSQPAWDAATGWGSPNGEDMVALLSQP